MKKKVELLAPAGDGDALRGAINAGADAVYLAGKSFGARAYANNFTEEEIMDALGTAHLFGVRIYLTANTLTRQSELPDLISFVSRLYDAGLDGVIVQDLGVAAELRKHCPGLPLHASTQMSITGPDGVRFLKRQGFSRVVPARELSLSEIRELKKTDIEIETFIHGAMCYSYSGRCLMSSFLGGRSGNRGRCAGTCRLPYEILDEGGERISLTEQDRTKRCTAGQKSGTYPLSMKDLCVLPILPDLMDAGIDSFKIEGRMKKAEYVAGVTAIYRSYIDRFYEWDEDSRPERWQIEQTDLDTLYSLYIRTDLSTGYYHERNGRDMLTIGRPGYRGTKPELLQEIRSRYLDQPPRRPICGTATIQVGRPIALTVTTATGLPADAAGSRRGREENRSGERNPASAARGADLSVRVTGSQVQPAQQRPLTEENIRSKLTKTGNSPFYFKEIYVETDGQSFLPVSELNELRRQALDQLQKQLLRRQQPKRNTTSSEWTLQVPQRESAPHLRQNSAHERLYSGQTKVPVDLAAQDQAENGRQQILVMVMTEGQAQAALDADADLLILDGPVRDRPEQILSAAHDTIPVLAALPHLLRMTDAGWMEQFLKKFGRKFYGFVTRNLEEVAFLKEREYDRTVIADSSLYCWNRAALESLKPYCSRNILPLELDQREIAVTFSEDLPRMVLPVYGRAPLMISANCIRKTAGRCRRKERQWNGHYETSADTAAAAATDQAASKNKKGESRTDGSLFYHLKDRTGAVMPVYTDCLYCQNVIYNSVPTSLLRCMTGHDPLTDQVGGLLLSFTTESAQETTTILRQFRTGSETNNIAFTYGHYRKGAQ